MDNFTANENWIDKLIDDYVDTKDELVSECIKSNNLYTLREIIFNNTRLDYGGDGLRIEGESAILEYLRAIYPDCYNKRLYVLKKEREAELKAQADILDNYIENNAKEGTDNG